MELWLTNKEMELLHALKEGAAELIALKKSAVPERVLVSANEAARLLGYAPAYISNLIRAKKLKWTTIGKSRGILLNDVLTYKTRREAVEP